MAVSAIKLHEPSTTVVTATIAIELHELIHPEPTELPANAKYAVQSLAVPIPKHAKLQL